MPRTIVDIPDSQLRDLDARCNALGISRAEAVRRAILEFLRGEKRAAGEAYGMWGKPSLATRGRSRLKQLW
jgi:metal-responsive CopG/Arc/MetJ family transcriptional regulator